MEIKQILSYFQSVKHLKGSSYQARCPCHKDNKASLTITAEGEKILMHCHAGCSVQSIVAAVGLEMSDLFIGEKPKKQPTWKDKLNVETVYNYGEYVKIRCKGKVIRYGRIVNDEFVSGVPEDIEKTIYRLDELRETINKGYPVYYVEGEKDADNLHKLGLTAVTAGGCGDWQKKFATHFRGARLVVLADNDEPGQKLAERIARDVKGIAYSVKVLTVSSEPHGDVSDYLESGGSKESLLSFVSRVETSYAPWVKVKDGKPSGILTDTLAAAVAQSLDYVIVNKPGLDIAEFYVFEDGVYRKCSKNEAKSWIKDYLPLGTATDNILNNVYNLLLCSKEKTYGFDQMNADERYINLQNGMLDLKTRQLEKHSPQILSTLQLNCNYNPRADCPRWKKFITELCTSADGIYDEEKERLLQEWFGLLISNVTVSRTKKCLVLTSPLGNTGKSVFLNILSYFVGVDNVTNIPIQNMSDRFSLGDICGKRLDIVGDQRADDILDSSVFKQLTGGDSVKVEFKGKQSFNYYFRGGIVMACNMLPAFTDDKGGHVFERLNIIACENVIPPEKRDGSLSARLSKEADGILNWALEGLYRLRDNRFKFSSCAADAEKVNEYRGQLDTLFGFMNERYEITLDSSDRVKKCDFEDEYLAWCKDNELTPLKKRNIKERAAKNGINLVKYHGEFFYKGIKPMMYFEVEENAPEPKVFEQQKLY